MLDLGTLRLGVKVDSDSAKSQLGEVESAVEGVDGKTSSLATKAKTMIKAFVAAYAVKELVKLGKAALDAYAQFEQLEGGVKKLFGEEDMDIVMKNANRAFETAGMSANQYMDTVTSFSAGLIRSLDGDTKKAAEVADMAIRDMSDNANTFGTDIQSIQNAYQGFAKQNYTMLDNLKLGYAGSKEGMEQLLADAEKISGQEYDISNLNEVYEAIHVIQEEMNITGTTANEAATTIEGSMNQMKGAWQNLLTSIGSGEGLDTAVDDFISSLGTVAQNIIPRVIVIAGSIVEGLVLAIPQIMMSLADAIGNFADNIDNLEGGKFVDTGIKLIGKLAKGLLQAVPALLVSVAKLISQVVKKFTGIDLFSAGANAIKSLLRGLKSVWTSITTWVSDKVNWIKEKFAGAKADAKSGTGHRIGLAEVPYDGYQAILHRGETVLTAAETNKIESLSSSAGTRQAMMEAVTAMLPTLRSGMVSALDGMDVVLDSRQVGRFMRKAVV